MPCELEQAGQLVDPVARHDLREADRERDREQAVGGERGDHRDEVVAARILELARDEGEVLEAGESPERDHDAARDRAQVVERRQDGVAAPVPVGQRQHDEHGREQDHRPRHDGLDTRAGLGPDEVRHDGGGEDRDGDDGPRRLRSVERVVDVLADDERAGGQADGDERDEEDGDGPGDARPETAGDEALDPARLGHGPDHVVEHEDHRDADRDREGPDHEHVAPADGIGDRRQEEDPRARDRPDRERDPVPKREVALQGHGSRRKIRPGLRTLAGSSARLSRRITSSSCSERE